MPPLRVFTARDTGVATKAWSAAQDRAGVMYFGFDTLVSFDGERWRSEKMDPTYLVRGLDIGPNGRIWTAGVNQIGWFEPGTQGRLEYHSLMPRLPEGAADLGDVWRVYASGNESAIFVAREKVLAWDGRKFASWDFPGMRLLWSTRTAKAVYVHYPPLGILRIGPAGPSLVASAAVIGSSAVRWLDDSGADWLLLNAQGFMSLHNARCTPVESEASSFVRANAPTSVARLGDGSLAIGTLQGGIAIVEPSGSIRRVFNVQSGLPANQIYSLFVDRDGALWGMGPSHIIRLTLGSDTSLYGQRSGYPAGGSDSLAEYSGETYIASHSGILRLAPDPESGGCGRFTALEATSSRFYSVLSTPEGLAVGHFYGLGLWSRAGMIPAIRSRDIVFRTNPSLSRPRAILASMVDSVVSVDLRNGQSEIVANSLPDYGDSVVDEPSGRIWIGTPSRGLFVAGPGTTRSVPAGPHFGPLPGVGPAWVARAGTTVVALVNGAAFFLDPGLDRFLPVSGFPAGNPYAVSNSDSRGSVWAALQPGPGGRTPILGKITVRGKAASWTPQSLEGLSAIGSLLGLRVVGPAGSEELWISGTESLLRAGPDALSPHPPPRKPLIRAWVMPGRLEPGDAIDGVMPYSTPGLHIEYSSLEYGMRESERFQTMLGGAESQWSPPTDSADRDLSGLREGSYDFRVRLVTDSGVAGEAETLHFDIAPPWWRTPLTRAAFVVAGALAVFGLLRLRTRSLERRAQFLERMVRQRTDELEKADAAKTEFVANMSHEIRNPMGGIMASALELSRTPLGPEQQKLVTTLRSCASFLGSLVEDVLDFAAIEAGAYKVTRSQFNPREVLENVVKMLEPRAAAARIDASVDPALPERILGDAARIQQVIVNFTVNSLKFGGRTIGLSARREEDHVVFTVADDGVGIPPEDQRNLFIRFSRLKTARNSAIPGTGLGLAVSRALAERMGGSVGYSTLPGHGSTFFLRIPLEAGAEALIEPRTFDARGSRALVVEDIKYNARALGAMLGELGFEVDFAVDGEEALARLSFAPYHMVFLDCDLPRVNGIEVARRFRASEPPGRPTVIIATTALSRVEDQNTCLSGGMDAFITKPITPEKLRVVLAPFCEPGPQAPCAVPRTPEIPGIDLGMLLHLTGGSPAGLGREVAGFLASLDEALLGVARAHESQSRPALSSAAHRVLSLARMVGAAALAGTAADLQEFAQVYTDAELADEIRMLRKHAGDLRSVLARCVNGAPLNPAWAS